MSLPVTLVPTQGNIPVVSGDVAAFWTAILTVVTLPSGLSASNIQQIVVTANTDGTLRVSATFKP